MSSFGIKIVIMLTILFCLSLIQQHLSMHL